MDETKPREPEHVAVRHDVPGCYIKPLPARLQLRAAHKAVAFNPANGIGVGAYPHVELDPGLIDPLRIAVLTAKYWGPQPRSLTVSFLESTAADLRDRIISHMNAWSLTAAFRFVYTQGAGQVRISRGSGGYYSYLGTDISLVPKSRQTMNLQSFTMSTPESEYKRVVRHETGHTLGFPHEHMRQAIVARIDKQKAYTYFQRTQGWDRATVDQQVLTPLDESSLVATAADQVSIMCYQLPASITTDGMPISGGLDIDKSDYDFAGQIYPKTTAGLDHVAGRESEEVEHDWDEAEDDDLVEVT